MLTQIHIRDLATIEALHLNFQTGSTMITGETGAGKSIFIEAIELGLGARGSANLIRPGKEKAEINLCFDITNFPRVIARLQELELHHDANECIIRRVLTSDGRSRCYINGTPANVQLVKELGDMLFHLHGQHEQQVLLKGDTQREMLDRYADHLDLAQKVKALAELNKVIAGKIETLQNESQKRAERSDYLRFQLEELATLNLKPGEWEVLEKDHNKLSHAEELIHLLQHAIHKLSEDEQDTLILTLKELRKTIESMQALEPKAKDWLANIDNVLIQVNDLESEIQNYLENIEIDPATLKALEDRLSQAFNLARKHKIAPTDLYKFQEKMIQELQAINSSDDEIENLIKQRDEITSQYTTAANILTKQRQSAACKLEQEITQIIRSLSLPHGEFRIGFELTPTDMQPLHGTERIVFQIKTNPDQTLQPLTKVISGGELSRLSLALHLALAHKTNIPTLVFDEVDTGLSGATAEKIGKLIRKLGNAYQVFCITHQPQVAACGHYHVLVEKNFIEQTTHTKLRLLTQQEKEQEIARMLGGEKITKKTLAHAQEVLKGI